MILEVENRMMRPDRGSGTRKTLCYSILVAAALVLAAATSAMAQEEPDHFRGEITLVGNPSIVVTAKDGKVVRLLIPDEITVIALDKGSFTTVDFGVYVGSVAIKLDEYSPIVRDSMSWLHRAYEFRIIDEQLRGIAAGHKKWSLTKDSIMAHGWVDDIEDRVISIKYGPTEEEETDVEVPRGTNVLKMSLGDKSLIRPGVHIFAGAKKNDDGDYVAQFIFAGKNGIIPGL